MQNERATPKRSTSESFLSKKAILRWALSLSPAQMGQILLQALLAKNRPVALAIIQSVPDGKAA